MKYIPISETVLRFPHYPVDVWLNALNSIEYFNNLIFSNTFKEAIYFASPELYKELLKYERKELKDKDSARLINTLVKYITRMAVRCTPFASFASCATASISDETNLVVSTDRLFRIRLDMSVVSQLAVSIQNDDKVKHISRFKLNSSIYLLGHRVRYISYSITSSGRRYVVSEVNNSPILQFIIGKIREFTYYSDIQHELMAEFGLNQEDVDKYISDLIRAQILICEFEPNVTGEDYLCRINNKSSIQSLMPPISQLMDDINAINKSIHFNDRKLLAEKIMDDLNQNFKVRCNQKYLLQMDSFYTDKTLSVSSEILNQVKRGFIFLNRITSRYDNVILNNFKKRFCEKYEDQEIPLMEAIDPEAGVGYQFVESKTYSPLIEGLKLPVHSLAPMVSLSPFIKLLMNKIVDSENKSIITITDDDMGLFPENSISDLPVTMSAVFKLVKDENDTEYVDGLFFTGSSAANLLGRFAYGDSAIHKIVSDVTDAERRFYEGVIVAEISHLSESRTGNVLFRPHVREYEIEYLTPSTLDADNVIPVSDLMISVKDNKIVLRSRKLNKMVIPRLTNAHNYSNNTTPVYRFLCDLQTQGQRPSLRFSWGMLDSALTHFPRVVYHDIIMARETWRCSTSDFMKKNKSNKTLFENWRKRLQLPRYVQLVNGDNILPIDFDNDMSVNAFISELSNTVNFVLEEFLFPSECCHDAEHNTYMNECIIPQMRVNLN